MPVVLIRGLLHRLVPIALYLAVTGSGLGWWQEARAQSGGQVQIQTLDGKSEAGRFAELSAEKVRLGGDTPAEWPRADVLRIDWISTPDGLLDNSPQLLLANGDRLGLRPVKIDSETLRGHWVRFPAWPEVAVPLETIRGALLVPPRSLLERSQAIMRLRDQSDTQDVFDLSNGDRLLGQLERFDQKSFELTSATGAVTVNQATVRGFGMNPELTSFPALKGEAALLTLSDGSLLTVTDASYSENNLLKCRAAFGAELEFPADQLVSLQFLGGRIVYLSDLEPLAYQVTPYLDRTWPLRRNQNAVGGPLRLASREYHRGIGMHSQSVVTYKLEREYDVFQATIGIDAVTEGRGSVIFRVLADGKPLFTSDIVRGKTPVLTVGPLAMSGVRELTLAVDYADQGDLLDHADWCDALLIKAKPQGTGPASRND